MLRRTLPYMIAGGLVVATTGVLAAEPATTGATTPPQNGTTLQKAKARKQAPTTSEQQRTDKSAQKTVTERGTSSPVTPASTRPMAPANESYHDCHSSSDA